MVPWKPISVEAIKVFTTSLNQLWTKVIKYCKITKPCQENISSVVEVLRSFLPKDCFKFCQKSSYPNLSFWDLWLFELEFCHNFSFCVIIFLAVKDFRFCWYCSFVTIQVLSFVPIWVFAFCHNSSFCVLLQFEFLSWVAHWVLKFLHN